MNCTCSEYQLYQVGCDCEASYGLGGYRDANGIEHVSHEDACRYYGADSPRQLQAIQKIVDAQYAADVLKFGQDQVNAWENEGRYCV